MPSPPVPNPVGPQTRTPYPPRTRQVADSLTELALERGSQDNVSVVFLLFQHGPAPGGGGGGRFRTWRSTRSLRHFLGGSRATESTRIAADGTVGGSACAYSAGPEQSSSYPSGSYPSAPDRWTAEESASPPLSRTLSSMGSLPEETLNTVMPSSAASQALLGCCGDESAGGDPARSQGIGHTREDRADTLNTVVSSPRQTITTREDRADTLNTVVSSPRQTSMRGSAEEP